MTPYSRNGKLNATGKALVAAFVTKWPDLPFGMAWLSQFAESGRLSFFLPIGLTAHDIKAIAAAAVCQAVATFDPAKCRYTGSPLERVSPMIHVTVRRTVLEALRSNDRFPVVTLPDDDTDGTFVVEVASAPLYDAGEVAAVVTFLDGWPEPGRTIVRMRYGIGTGWVMSLADMARTLRVSKETINRHLAAFHAAARGG